MTIIIIINALLVVVDPDLLLTSLPLCARDRQHQRGAKWFLNRKEKKKRHVNLQVPPVDLVDDLQVARQEILEEVNRPALQSFRQDGVVGVGTGTSDNVPGLRTHKCVRDSVQA